MTETTTRTLASDRQADIIQVETVRVTKTDIAKAERVAKADRLTRLVAESAAAVAIVDERERSGLVALVDTYQTRPDQTRPLPGLVWWHWWTRTVPWVIRS